MIEMAAVLMLTISEFVKAETWVELSAANWAVLNDWTSDVLSPCI
jgi:hypothetical protein